VIALDLVIAVWKS